MKLEDKIHYWIEKNPDRIYAGQQMFKQLRAINTTMEGSQRENLLFILGETIDKLEEIDATTHATVDYLDSLNESLADLINTTVDCIGMVESTPQKTRSVIPEVPVLDKSLN